ncbi:hypothetical protein V2J09_015540 [Rumex salicifolius]
MTTLAQPIDLEAASSGSDRAQWLRAAVLGANDGLLSTAALMIGIGSVSKDHGPMILVGVAGLLAGAFSMAIGEFVSVYSQYDIELSKLVRETNCLVDGPRFKEMKRGLPSPIRAAVASAVSFAVGAAIPLMAAAFIRSYNVRVGVVVGTVSVSLLGFGWIAAVLGQATSRVMSAARVLVGGWVAMGVTFGLTKLVGSSINVA